MDGVRGLSGGQGAIGIACRCVQVPMGSGADRFRCRWVQWPMGLWADEVGTDGVGTDGVRGGWV